MTNKAALVANFKTVYYLMNCIAIDDEPLALEVLKKYIGKQPELNLRAVFSNPLQSIDYLNKTSVELIFLDIHMPEINGLQLYRNLAVKPMVIFTTAQPQYAVDAFDVNAVDYLLKPFNFLRFEQAVNKAISRIKPVEKELVIPLQFLHIHSGYKMIKVPVAEIIYIEALDDYVKIITASQSYLTLLSMKKIMDRLPEDKFVRIHRSYIVAAQKIAFYQYRKLGLTNNIELPVGDTYRTTIAALKNTTG